MSTTTDNRSPEEIERDIQQTRSHMGSTLDELQHRMSPGQMMDQVMNYFRGSSSGDGSSSTQQMMSSVSETVKQNPMPLFLIGAGLAWMMMNNNNSGSSRTSTASYPVGGRVQTPYDPVDSSYAQAPLVDEYGVPIDPGYDYGDYDSSPSMKDRAAGAAAGAKAGMHSAGAKASDAAHRTGEGVSNAAHRVGSGASNAAHRVGSGASNAAHRERISDSARYARERTSAGMHRASEAARHRAWRASQYSQYQYRRAQRGFEYMLEEQPLALGAVGFAIGAAVGAAIPPTRREDQWMGSTRDNMMTQAEAYGREQAARAQAVAQAAANAARDAADQEGINRDAGKAEADKAKQKVDHVVDAATEAAKDEADRQNLGSASSSGTGV